MTVWQLWSCDGWVVDGSELAEDVIKQSSFSASLWLLNRCCDVSTLGKTKFGKGKHRKPLALSAPLAADCTCLGTPLADGHTERQEKLFIKSFFYIYFFLMEKNGKDSKETNINSTSQIQMFIKSLRHFECFHKATGCTDAYTCMEMSSSWRYTVVIQCPLPSHCKGLMHERFIRQNFPKIKRKMNKNSSSWPIESLGAQQEGVSL